MLVTFVEVPITFGSVMDFAVRCLPVWCMSDLDNPLESRVNREEPEDFGHPRGTLAIVAAFGVLFLLGWLIMYFYLFLQRGAPHS